MLVTLVSVILTLLTSLLLTPLARRVAIRFQILASPNHRTVHSKLTPQLGGLSIFIAFATGLGCLALYKGEMSFPWGLMISSGLVLVVGLLDDVYHLSCYRKLIGQLLAAIVAVYFGFTIDTIYLPVGISIELGYLALPVSVLWIISVTNAVNLLDGLDGLASGFSVIVGLTVLACSIAFSNAPIGAASLMLTVATMGFLKYNLSPAKIFLGDTGSLFLGFTLACLSIKAFSLPNTGSHIIALLVLFSIPLVDTVLSILRRISGGQHPFSADKKHLHHRLLLFGFGPKRAVLIVYFATFMCGISTLLLFVANVFLSTIVLSGLFAFSVYGLYRLSCFDFLQQRHDSRTWVNAGERKRLEAL